MLTVSKLDDYIDKKYKKTTGSRHTKEIMLEFKNNFFRPNERK